MQLRSTLTLVIALLTCSIATTVLAQDLTVQSIMRDQKWIGSLPDEIRWSEDSRWIYFDWNPEGLEGDSLYKVSRDGGEPQKVSFEERQAMPSEDGDYNRARTKKVYTKDGDVFLLDIASSEVRQITNTVDWKRDPQFTFDETGIVYRLGNDLYLWDMATGSTSQLTDFKSGQEPDQEESLNEQEAWLGAQELTLIETLARRKARRERSEVADEATEPERPLKIYVGKESVDHVNLSPDGRFVVFLLEKDAKEAKIAEVPFYVTESGYTEMRSTHAKVGAPQGTQRSGIYDRERDTVYYLKTDSIPGIFDQPEYLAEKKQDDSDGAKPAAREVWYRGPVWSDDGKRALVDIRSYDHKDRWLMTLDLETAGLTLVDRQHDDAWIGGPGIGWWWHIMGWLPDNRRVWFQSEATGYSHLYTVDVESGKKRQLTRGEWEVSYLELSHDKKNWYFNANMVLPGEKRFYRLPVEGGEPEELTPRPGRSRVYTSPDETKLAIRYSYSNVPRQLYIQDNEPGAEPVQLTDALSDEFRAYPWRDPELIQFEAEDGAKVWARFYRPVDPPTQRPAVIFVHGAGYLQNAHRWWSSYQREYMFHNLLADHGYTVLDIDYRGSAGYGRDSRTAIYRHMGGKDLSDQVDGAKLLVEEFGVDPERIGIYGGSYGGFITLMAMFKHPDVFAAGAALRSVTDWAHYHQGYTSSILNLPYLDSLAYVRSSPIYFAEGLEGALLMCHGMGDRNVHFQDVVRLSQRLIELGKENWELAVYPLEGHSFLEPESWTDEYRRIFELFEENLK